MDTVSPRSVSQRRRQARECAMRDTLNGTIKHDVDEHSTVGSTELNEPLCISHDPSLEHHTWDSLSLSTDTSVPSVPSTDSSSLRSLAQRHRRARERATGEGTIATAKHNGSERMSISELYKRLHFSPPVTRTSYTAFVVGFYRNIQPVRSSGSH
ncbi:hypothetical protein BC826DRAFT_129680 [Russula brevipes]|nr:hypothetical protein BC826DRAFT_129680 [Russula brevipes]